MGQTLTHGIYLPDEGERNCYNGLAANWQLLDGAVGTVAEHTTALSGKASLVHTHTKSQITDFPAYGTAAGTICEGNDSRLSDARTPVAHTHTKSDVTDLLNSNFIPSANNSYDLGSSSYQWNNLYAKNYYYNGVAWGLDKANVWSANNEYKYLIGLSGAEIWFKHPNIEDITANPDANISKSIIQIYNKATTQYFGGISDSLRTDGSHRLTISCFGFPLNNYAGYYPHTFYFEAKRDGTASFSPSYTNASLGTSTNRWKTLNGVNPGALSLPVRGYTDSISLDTTNWDYAGNGFSIPMTDNNGNYIPGWVVIVAEDVGDAFDYIKVRTTSYTRSPGLDFATFYTGSQYNIKACFPIDSIMYLVLKLTNGASCIKYARYYPCLGNV